MFSGEHWLSMKSFTDLRVWHHAMELLSEVHDITKIFPEHERYGLTKQLRRSTQSIVGNIGEGFGRFSFADKANKYVIARGECSETRAHLLVAIRIEYVTEERAARALELTTTVGKMLSGLISSCHRRARIL